MVQNNSLSIGGTYTLKYNNPWQNYDVIDIKVTAITTDKESSAYGLESVYAEFFSAYGLGLSTYVSSMNACNDIYVCEVIKSKDPFSLEKGFVLIPKVMIDFVNSDVLYICDKISITISDVISHSETVYARGKFIENVSDHIRNSLKTIEEFGDVNVNINIASSDTVMAKFDYESYDEFRKKSFESANLAALYEKSRLSREFRDMSTRYREMQDTIETYNRMILEVEEEIANLQAAKSAYDDNVAKANLIRGDLLDLFDGLEDGSITINSSAYTTLKTKISMFIGSYPN